MQREEDGTVRHKKEEDHWEASWIIAEKNMQKVGVAKEVICCGDP